MTRVLVIVAHPDDAEYAAGGSIARWRRDGVTVRLCSVTSGNATDDRRSEQREAARVLGINDVLLLDYPDGDVAQRERSLRDEMVALVRDFRPHRVVTHSPEYNWTRDIYLHPDHRAVGRTALDAIYPLARQPIRDELGEPWSVRELWLIQAPPERINHYEDITDMLAIKATALAAHTSQLRTGPSALERVEAAASGCARRAGWQEPRMAEAFQIVSLTP